MTNEYWVEINTKIVPKNILIGATFLYSADLKADENLNHWFM